MKGAAIIIDWPRLLGDIAYMLGDLDPTSGRRVEVSAVRLAAALNVPRGTLRGWAEGQCPRHHDGEALLERWCALTGKPREFAPMERRAMSAGEMRRLA